MKKTKEENEKEEARKEREIICNERYEYKSKLDRLWVETYYQLEVLFRAEFSQKPTKELSFYRNFNGRQITVAEFLYFLGAFMVLFQDARIKIAMLKNIREERDKADIINLENFLKEVPGAKLPPRPERVDAWLKEEPSEESPALNFIQS